MRCGHHTNRKAVAPTSPTLPLRLRWVWKCFNIKSTAKRLRPPAQRCRCGYVGIKPRGHHINRNAVASVPYVPFIPFDPMSAQEHTEFILESNFVMMLFLIRNISRDLFQIGLAHRKIGVTALPLKIVKLELLFQPEVRYTFQFLYPFSLCDRTSEASEEVNMIFHAHGLELARSRAYSKCRQAERVALFDVIIAQGRLAVLRRKDQVNVNGRKRLRHLGFSFERADWRNRVAVG